MLRRDTKSGAPYCVDRRGCDARVGIVKYVKATEDTFPMPQAPGFRGTPRGNLIQSRWILFGVQ